MSRYIDANALIERFRHFPPFLVASKFTKDGIVDLIVFQPTANVVEVVRCKDCKHYCLSDYKKPDEPKWCEMHDDGYFYPQPNDYCSYGERRDQNELD